jgi:RNA polymerase sigma factor (sigma-70 family)
MSNVIRYMDANLSAVVLRERPRLWKFIRRRVLNQADAEDILQDVFYAFVEAYRFPESIEQASAWLYRVARNRIIDRFRRNKVHGASPPVAGPDDADEYRLDLELPMTGGPDADYASSVLLTALQRALQALPDSQREVFLAHELEGRSFRQMAAHSDVPLNTLLARKRYAVLFLRERLQSVYDELEL